MITWTITSPLTEGAGPARDMLLGDDGDLYVGPDLALVAGAPAAAQRANVSTSMFQGEWFLDRDAGVPYFQRILVKNPNLVEVQDWLRQAVLDNRDIDALDNITVTYIGNRQVRVDWKAHINVNGGQVITASGSISP